MRFRALAGLVLVALAAGCAGSAATGGDDEANEGDDAAVDDARGALPDATARDGGAQAGDGATEAGIHADGGGSGDSSSSGEDATADAAIDAADATAGPDAALDSGSGAVDSGHAAEDAAVDAPTGAGDAGVHDAGADVGDATLPEDATTGQDATTSEDAASDGAGSVDAAGEDAAKDAASADTGTTTGMDAAADGGSCAAGASFSGGLTSYTQTAANACGQPWPDSWSVDNGFPAVALNTALFDQGSAVSACNKCVSVTGTTGAVATFVVVDQCPAGSNAMWCQTNHLDIDGLASYNLVENGAPGSIDNSPGVPIAAPYPGPVSWKYVPCPWTAGLTYLFQPNGLSGASYFYLALNVYHSRYGLQTVRYRSGGNWVDLQPRTDDQQGNVNGNFVINGVVIPDPIDLQVVDEYGQVVEDDAVSWSAPSSTFQSSHQFPTCN